MAPWKTSTAGSARSTSTSSNRRQACLKAALRGGFLISPPLHAQTRDIVRHSSLPLRPTSFAMRSLGGVQFEIKKNEYRRHAISHGPGRKMPHSKPVSAFEFVPDECQHLFHSQNAASQSSRKHETAKRNHAITHGLEALCIPATRQRAGGGAKTGQQEKSHPVGWLCNRLRVCESYLSHVLGSTAWPALAMLRNSEAAVNITSEAEFKAVSQES